MSLDAGVMVRRRALRIKTIRKCFNN